MASYTNASTCINHALRCMHRIRSDDVSVCDVIRVLSFQYFFQQGQRVDLHADYLIYSNIIQNIIRNHVYFYILHFIIC